MIRIFLKKVIKKIFTLVDIGFYSVKKKKEDESRQLEWIKAFNAKTVLDIGANIGQFAEQARDYYPTSNIYSFEPITFCFDQLKMKFADDAKLKVYNVALGDKEEISEIYLNDYSASSSILEMLDLHKEVLPVTANFKKNKISIKRLESYSDEIFIEHPLLIKLDVQGFEKNVIEGGEFFFDNADIIIIEITFVPLYKNQPLFDEIYSILRNKGFEFRGYLPVLNSLDGTILQGDGIFIKK
jgi:FkbM family methyltransferase